MKTKPGEDQEVLDRFRAFTFCEYCKKPLKYDAEPAHILSKGAGRADIPENIVALGGPRDCGCHQRSHYSGIPSTSALFEIAAAREKTTAEACRLKVYEIRRKRWRKA